MDQYDVFRIAIAIAVIGALIALGFSLGRYYEQRDLSQTPPTVEQADTQTNPEPEPVCSLEEVVCAHERQPQRPVVQQAAAATDSAGKASWYAKGLKNPYTEATAASTRLPRGSRARVTNVETGKSVDVLINDYGPNPTIHPDRVIDLSAFAFEQLAPLGRGIISVTVTPL